MPRIFSKLHYEFAHKVVGMDGYHEFRLHELDYELDVFCAGVAACVKIQKL